MANYFLGENHETRGGSLSSQKRMEIFLRSISDPNFQISVGEEVGVHRTTVNKTIALVSNKIYEMVMILIFSIFKFLHS